MMSKKNGPLFALAFLFTAAGVYNSVVIESHSSLDSSQYALVRRLDAGGMSRPARMLASSTRWQKLSVAVVQKQVAQIQNKKQNDHLPAVAEEILPQDLNLSLVEVINPEMFKDGLADTDFAGILTTNGSQIETLEISLPQGLGFSVAYSEINGNVFEYESNGATYSGMLYQVDANAYMVSFTAGELAGTRLRFQSKASEQFENLAEVVAVDVGQFGQEGYEAEEMASLDRSLQEQGLSGSFAF